MATTIFPEIYVQELPNLPPAVHAVETAIPVFIGYTQKAQQHLPKDLLFQPTKISSLTEYETYFGPPFAETSIQVLVDTSLPANIIAKASLVNPSPYLLHYSLQLFFKNGGGPSHIISVGNYTNRGAISFKALSRGLQVASALSDATLLVFPDSTRLSSVTDYYLLHKQALLQAAERKDRFVVMDVWTNNNDTAFNPVHALRSSDLGETGSRQYGAAYYPGLRTNINVYYGGKDDKVKIVCANDHGLNGTLKALKKKNEACYTAAKKAVENSMMVLPASASVVGVYARVDRTRGVWKAPANDTISGVIEPEVVISDNLQSELNMDPVAGKSINVIRQFTGKGTLIWGARTLAGNDNEWRYVPVRRFAIMIEVSLTKALQSFVFEANDANTWVKIKLMIDNYFVQLWRSGALAGTKPEHAFFVAVGLGTTMTANDLLDGRLIVEYGLAIVRPAEFIIQRIEVKMAAP